MLTWLDLTCPLKLMTLTYNSNTTKQIFEFFIILNIQFILSVSNYQSYLRHHMGAFSHTTTKKLVKAFVFAISMEIFVAKFNKCSDGFPFLANKTTFSYNRDDILEKEYCK